MGNETPEQAEAIGLHYEIVSAAQAAASSLLDLGRKLKRMRDSGKYKALALKRSGTTPNRPSTFASARLILTSALWRSCPRS